MRNLRKGMRGPDVRQWQEFLDRRGIWVGAVDGIFGGVTFRATLQFQQGQGLEPDGIVGPATRARAEQLGLGTVKVQEDAAPPPPPAGGGVAVTPALLRRVMPGIRPAHAEEYAPFLQRAMAEFGITSPPRAAAFLAQLAHESGQLRFMEEIWGPTAAQRRYEPPTKLARTLGNVQPGDGKRFKGRGPIQLTGRANYRTFGDTLGVDLVAKPALAASKEVGFRIAALYWKKRGLNPLADRRDFREITRRINGGFNGLADRERFYRLAKGILGVVPGRAAGAGPAGAMRGIDREGADWRSFTRGLDGPGEVVPTAAQRGAARPVTKAAARKATATKATARKATRKPAAKPAGKKATKAPARKPAAQAARKPPARPRPKTRATPAPRKPPARVTTR